MCMSDSLLIAVWLLCLVFFFKQKTAYELRISDWSSDVCSSDLSAAGVASTGEEAPAKRTEVETPKAAERPAVTAKVTDPGLPEGTEFESQTVREALRDAMAEEMRADDRIFVMGEEVAE